jgi:hypothetical protein
MEMEITERESLHFALRFGSSLAFRRRNSSGTDDDPVLAASEGSDRHDSRHQVEAKWAELRHFVGRISRNNINPQMRGPDPGCVAVK